MRLLDKYILKSLCRSIPIWGICFYQYFHWYRYIIPHCSIYNRIWCSATTRYESLLFSYAKHYFIDIPYVCIAWFADGFQQTKVVLVKS